ncbi:MAG: hypothetical protein RL757_3276 [Bacteroidota bacterium]
MKNDKKNTFSLPFGGLILGGGLFLLFFYKNLFFLTLFFLYFIDLKRVLNFKNNTCFLIR